MRTNQPDALAACADAEKCSHVRRAYYLEAASVTEAVIQTARAVAR